MHAFHHILTLSFPFSSESVKSGIENDPKLIAIWCMIVGFITTTVIILLTTLYLRRRKNQSQNKTLQLNNKYHQYLSELASGDYENKALELMASSKESTLSLAKQDFTQSFHRSTLLKELMSLHRELAGQAAHRLRETYLTLGYKEDSLKKLKNSSWTIRVEGIQELNQMDIKDGYVPLFKLVNDNNKVVRLEAILARMKMDIEPLSFFKELRKELTDWEHLRIHFLLQKLPLEEVPSFLPFLNHKLLSVQLFSIKMVAIFNQIEAEDQLLKKLGTTNTSINLTILESLAEIGTEKTVEFLHANYEAVDSKLKVSIIKTLLNISGEDEIEFFISQLQPEAYDIQLAAANALASLGKKGNQLLNEQIELLPINTQHIIEHAQQWKNN